jgi:hypothetical protein
MSGSTSSVLILFSVGARIIGTIIKIAIFIRCREKMRLNILTKGAAVPGTGIGVPELSCSIGVAFIPIQ